MGLGYFWSIHETNNKRQYMVNVRTDFKNLTDENRLEHIWKVAYSLYFPGDLNFIYLFSLVVAHIAIDFSELFKPVLIDYVVWNKQYANKFKNKI